MPPSHRDTSTLKARKEPQQERSRELVTAVLEAATRILREGGPDALTIPELCAVAGVSPGSFYQYFPNKDAVLYALLRGHAERVTQGITAVLARYGGGDPEVVVEAAVTAFIAEHRADPAVHSALGHIVATRAGPGLEEDLMRTGEAALGALLDARRAELGGRDPKVTAFLLVRTLEGVVHAATRDAPELLDDPQFARGLQTMLLAALRDPAVPDKT